MKDNTATREQLIQLYQAVRNQTETQCKELAIEDYVIQSIDDVSPPKWHLAHTTWFFETFLLRLHLPKYKIFHDEFHYLFNSYYQSIGNPYPRAKRGLLSRPTVKTIFEYRHYVDQCFIDYLQQIESVELANLSATILLGIHHEQQHQELLLMDIKHNFSIHLEFPVYHKHKLDNAPSQLKQLKFIHTEGGIVEVGHLGNEFCFDNELPRHAHILNSYAMANRLVTNAEYCEFIEMGGYQKPDWWLSDGWECVSKNHWQAPLYWQKSQGKWHVFTLSGLQELNPAEPVSHVSYYEADAYARWCGFRLPSEIEWEYYVYKNEINPDIGNFLENDVLHPTSNNNSKNQQLFGDVWEWTTSAYSPYPGYKSLHGALGEYNGKFMSNQFVLRGGSCVTPQSHIRATYRNFFQPDKRWQFSGIRLASDA